MSDFRTVLLYVSNLPQTTAVVVRKIGLTFRYKCKPNTNAVFNVVRRPESPWGEIDGKPI